MGSISSRPTEESVQSEQTNLDYQQVYSSHQGPSINDCDHSLPLTRFINSIPEPTVRVDASYSSQLSTARVGEHTTGLDANFEDSFQHTKHDDDKMVYNKNTVDTFDTLDLSAIPPAEEYWKWDDTVNRCYHRDEDTQLVVWYRPLD